MSEFIIKAKDNYANLLLSDEKENIAKTIKLESLIKAFQTTENKICSPILPYGTIKYIENGNNIEIIVLHKSNKYEMTCNKKIYENCITPNIVIKYILKVTDSGTMGKLYNISETTMFGIRDNVQLIGNGTKLYGLPFPNVDSKGWMCWGANSLSGQISALSGLSNYIDRFFTTPFNGHLFNSSFLSQFGINKPEDLFDKISNADNFPVEYLEHLSSKNVLGGM